jgi:hypothetical protein
MFVCIYFVSELIIFSANIVTSNDCAFCGCCGNGVDRVDYRL